MPYSFVMKNFLKTFRLKILQGQVPLSSDCMWLQAAHQCTAGTVPKHKGGSFFLFSNSVVAFVIRKPDQWEVYKHQNHVPAFLSHLQGYSSQYIADWCTHESNGFMPTMLLILGLSWDRMETCRKDCFKAINLSFGWRVCIYYSMRSQKVITEIHSTIIHLKMKLLII